MDVDEALAAAGEAAASGTTMPDFIIDADMRTVAVPESGTVLGVEGDRDTNTVRFLLPSVYRGCDLSGFSCRVSYVNPAGETGWYDVTDMAETTDGSGTLSFTWLVSDTVVRYRGAVRFSVNLREMADDGVTVRRAFDSTVAEVTSLEGLPTPTSRPASEYEDLLAMVDRRINSLGRDLTWGTA